MKVKKRYIEMKVCLNESILHIGIKVVNKFITNVMDRKVWRLKVRPQNTTKKM